jgi:hypothetical protein
MTAHSKEWADLRVGCRATLHDWRGDTITGITFWSGTGDWLLRTGTGAVFPVTPRELIRVANGASETWKRLVPGARVTFAAWDGSKVTGIAQKIPAGIWECKEANGARWLLEPRAVISIQEVETCAG